MSTIALKRLIINGRFLSQRKTGVQALIELIRKLAMPDGLEVKQRPSTAIVFIFSYPIKTGDFRA